jgi:hypothetical protein
MNKAAPTRRTPRNDYSRAEAPSRPWWLVIAYLLCAVAGCVGPWGLSLPLLDSIR